MSVNTGKYFAAARKVIFLGRMVDIKTANWNAKVQHRRVIRMGKKQEVVFDDVDECVNEEVIAVCERV